MELNCIIKEVQDLHKTVSKRLPDELSEMVEHVKDLREIKSRLTVIASVLESQYNADKYKIRELMVDEDFKKLSKKVQDAYVDSLGHRFKAIIKQVDLMHSECSSAERLAITLISYEKATAMGLNGELGTIRKS